MEEGGAPAAAEEEGHRSRRGVEVRRVEYVRMAGGKVVKRKNYKEGRSCACRIEGDLDSQAEGYRFLDRCLGG